MAAVMETRVLEAADGTALQVDDVSQSDSGEEEEDDGGEEDELDDGGDEDGSEDGSEDAGDEKDDGNPNAGWAEAMAKIIGKNTEDAQSSILVKNKELEKVKEKERQEYLERKKQLDKKRAWEMMSRVKPDVVKDRETERALQRVATRGVVQLFNAVRKHQRTVEEKVKEVGGSERKKAKLLSSVSKKDFINVLRGREDGGGKNLTDKSPPTAEDANPSWSVLSDNFMMGASMKDWDKHSDDDDEEERGAGGEEDESDSD